jgi:hypothetical protein
LALYKGDCQNRKRREHRLALSLVFYGYWDVRFLPLLVASILV